MEKGTVQSRTRGADDHGRMIFHLSDVSKFKLYIEADQERCLLCKDEPHRVCIFLLGSPPLSIQLPFQDLPGSRKKVLKEVVPKPETNKLFLGSSVVMHNSSPESVKTKHLSLSKGNNDKGKETYISLSVWESYYEISQDVNLHSFTVPWTFHTSVTGKDKDSFEN